MKFELLPKNEKQSFYPLCLAVSFFSSLPSAVFFSNQNPLFSLLVSASFSPCATCVGLLVKGLGLAGLHTVGQQECVVQLMS